MTDARARFGGEVTDVAVPGGFVRTETIGSGPPLLLLHGWTLDRRIWAPQLPLAAQRQLILVDRRGFGQSTAPPDLAQEPRDLLAVLDALGIARTAVGGLSQGGRVAVHLALAAAPRVSGLVLLGAPIDGLAGPDDPPAPLDAMRAAVAASDRGRLAALVGRHPFLTAHAPDAARVLDPILRDYAGRDLLAPPTALPLDGRALRALPMPLAAAAGALDTPRRRRSAAALATAAPTGRAFEIPGAGHLCNLDNPQAVNRLLATAVDAALPVHPSGANEGRRIAGSPSPLGRPTSSG